MLSPSSCGASGDGAPGWVTGVPNLSRPQQLKILGNGVVPQQAMMALEMLGVSPPITSSSVQDSTPDTATEGTSLPTLTTPPRDVPRDRWGRPMLLDPATGKREAYTRVTTLAKALDDQSTLMQWKSRMTALGLAQRPDLMAVVSGCKPEDKRQLDEACEAAQEAGGASTNRNLGTALHSLTEFLDRREKPPAVPVELRGHLAGYLRLRKERGIRIEAIEKFVAVPELKVAGTTDRIVTIDGRRHVADIKTGRVDYGMQGFAVQLACYAHGVAYDIEGDAWGEQIDVDTSVGYIIHLPVDGGEPSLLAVDIAAGWRAAKVSAWVREWRKAKVAL